MPPLKLSSQSTLSKIEISLLHTNLPLLVKDIKKLNTKVQGFHYFFSTRTSGFYRQAKLFELKLCEKCPSACSNQVSKTIRPGQFACCPALNETLPLCFFYRNVCCFSEIVLSKKISSPFLRKDFGFNPPPHSVLEFP